MILTSSDINKRNVFKKEALISWSVFFLLASVLAGLIDSSFTVTIISVSWVVLGLFFIRLAFPKAGRFDTYRLWVLFMLVYFLYMLISSTVYVKNPYNDFFFHVDSLYFFRTVDIALINNYDFGRLLFEGRHWPGFATISWLLGRLAHSLGEVNSIILQKSQIVFVSGMTVVFLYRSARIYFEHSIAWKIAVSFGFLTHVFAFSGTFTRDPHITFLFAIALYVFLSKWRIQGVLILILLGVLCAQFRFQHGVYFIVIVAAYIYMRVKTLRNKIVSFFFYILFTVCFVGFILLMVQSYQRETVEKIETYQEYHQDGFEDASGFSGLISRLPAFIQPIGMMVVSQTYPLPPTRAIYVKAARGNQYMLFPLVLSQPYWLFVWAVLLYGIIYLNGLQLLPLNLKLTLFIAVFLILIISTGSYEYRRMMGAYPAIYLVSAYLYFKSNLRVRTKMLLHLSIVLIMFYLFYFMVKGLIL